jgi:TIGR03009 family protein
MTRLIFFGVVTVVVAAAGTVWGQAAPPRGAKSAYLPPGGPRVADSTPTITIPAAGATPIQQPPAGQMPNAGAPAATPAPQPPQWALQIDPKEAKWVEEVLGYWEARSNKIKTFECKFKRWDYDPIFGPKTDAKTYAEGSIKYAEPDKGLFKVEKLLQYAPPVKTGDAASYVEQDANLGEHWICDGKVIYAFEGSKKQVTVTPLPPEMQGRAIADGPLPFMFGAKAATINARYWIHGLPPGSIPGLPEGGKGKYCLEAVPKSRQDAQNFCQVWLVLDEKEFLPEIIEIFAPNFHPQQNPSRQTFVFLERVTKDQAGLAAAAKDVIDPLKLFHRNFFEPATPTGWKKVVLNNAPAAGPPPPETARPGANQRQLAPLPR